jgi:hypothetical protein
MVDMEDRVARVLERDLGVSREEVLAAARGIGIPAGSLKEVGAFKAARK